MSTIKFVEKEIMGGNEFGVFRNDYSESLSEQMTMIIDGVYMSIPQQAIELKRFSCKNKRLVKGYDFGNNNILSREQKIIECVQYLDERNTMFVAFAYSDEYKLGFDVYLYRIDLNDTENQKAFDDVNRNIFNIIVPEKLTDKGIYRHLAFNNEENALTWDCFETDTEKICHTIHYNLIAKTMRKVLQQKKYDRQIEYLIEQTIINTNKQIHYEQVNDNLYVVVIEPEHKQSETRNPAIVVCLGGLNITIPDFYVDNSIYELFRRHNYYVIVPLRRGIIGISYEWEHALAGRCGKEEIDDILCGTQHVIEKYHNKIDCSRIGLYGGSYGGFSAMLINGKYNDNQMFKAIIAHCGVFDLEAYPQECHGKEVNIMNGYVNTNDVNVYIEKIKEISPHYFVKNWQVPTLIIHALDDSSVWFGQSVKAYNVALEYKKNVQLILNKGPHSYNVENMELIFCKIFYFLNNAFRKC